MRRILSMDILRGWAILLMVVFHIFLNISDLVRKAGNLANISIGELILIAFIAVFVHWQSFFLMISAIVHWYSMTRLQNKGVTPLQILKKQLLFGIFIYVLGFLREPFLSPWGITQEWFLTGTLSLERWVFIYRAETLSNIGISVILTSLIFFAFTFFAKTSWTPRVQIAVKVGIMGVLALVFVFTAPLMQTWVNTLSTINLQVSDAYMYTALDQNGGYFNRWILNTLAGREFPLFPNYSYFLLGSIVGLLISAPQPSQKLPRYLVIPGVILLVGGAIYWILVDHLIATLDITFHIHPTGFVLFSMGLQLLIIALFFRMYEFHPRMTNEVTQQKVLKRSRWIRRWGVFSLIIYVFNILEFLPRYLLNFVIPQANYRTNNNTTLPYTLLMVVIVLILWELVIRGVGWLKQHPIKPWLLAHLPGKQNRIIPSTSDPMMNTLDDVTPIVFVSKLMPISDEILNE